MVYLFEAFLGTEEVLSALAAHLTRALEHPEWWGTSPDSEASEVGSRREGLALAPKNSCPTLGYMALLAGC